MKLKFIQLEQTWPPDIPIADLRLFLKDQLEIYGEPLRWAITAIEESKDDEKLRTLRLEAVLIISD